MQHLSFQFCCVFFNVYLTSCLTASFPQLEPGKAREHHWADKKEHGTEVGIQGVSHFKGSPAPLLSYFKARRRGLLKKGQYTFKLSLLRDTQSWRILLFWKWWRRHALTACSFCFQFTSVHNHRAAHLRSEDDNWRLSSNKLAGYLK